MAIPRRPLILEAVETGDVKRVAKLLNDGEDIQAVGSYGETAAHVAAARGNKEMLEFLIMRGADVNSKDSTNSTPLMYAVDTDNYDIVKFLLQNKALIDLVNLNGETALMLAMGATGDFKVKVIEALLEEKANPNIKNNFGNTALHFAVRGGPSRHFLEKGTQIKVIKALLKAGADVTEENNNNDRPIDMAPDYAREEIEALDEFQSSRKNRP